MKKEIPIEDKIYHVKMITNRLDKKVHPTDPKTMLASINAKMSIINKLLEAA
jgi:hypothetical protein